MKDAVKEERVFECTSESHNDQQEDKKCLRKSWL